MGYQRIKGEFIKVCKVGDIILIQNAMRDGQEIGRHSFIVINTDGGQIEGVPFDFVCNVMSSFTGKGQAYKLRKLSYPDNIPYDPNDVNVPNGNDKEGFIKPGVLFYFDQSKIDFEVIGDISIDLYNRIMEFIKNADSIEVVTDNLG